MNIDLKIVFLNKIKFKRFCHNYNLLSCNTFHRFKQYWKVTNFLVAAYLCNSNRIYTKHQTYILLFATRNIIALITTDAILYCIDIVN